MSDEPPPPPSPTPPARAYEVLTPGEKFGNYQVLRCVSYDLLGNLYRVRKPRSKSEQTVFVLPPVVKMTETFTKRFNEFGPKLCGLEHPNVFAFGEASTVRDRFTFLGGPFDGVNIADYLQDYVNKQLKERNSNQPNETNELVSDLPMGLPPEEVHTVIQQVLAGLLYLYQNKIQHLNLNPTNILRCADGSIKVAGFGLFNLIGQERFEEIVSAGIPPVAIGGKAVRINTVDILSPEARQGRPSDQRSDVYALGISTYWLLTGRKPATPYVKPSEIVAGLDEKWDIFTANCLDREPERRYQTIAKTAEDFEDFQSIRPIRTATRKSAVGTEEATTIFRHIDFIPVPQRLKDRGIKTTRAFRLAVLGTVLLTLSSLFFSTLHQGSKLGPFPDTQVAIRTPEGKQPRLSFELEPSRILVNIASTPTRFTVTDGKLDLNILPGTYDFEFSSPGYRKLSRQLEIGDKPIQQRIRLEPAWAPVTFTSLPGTKLTAINDQDAVIELGVTDDTGKLVVTEKLTAGDYEITADKEGYAITDSGPFTLSAKDENLIEVPVDAVLGVLRVRSKPRGATIVFRGENIGTTNETLRDLPVDEEFTLTLKLPGYRDSTLAVMVASDTRTVLDFGELTPLSGEIALDINLGGEPATPEQIQQASISVTATNEVLGEQQLTIPGTQLIDDNQIIKGVYEGEVTLTIIHPDYRDATKQFTLGNQIRARLNFDLEALPGIVSLELQPAGEAWEFEFDGRPVKLPEMKAPLPAGVESTLTVKSPNYFPQSKTFTPAANQRFTWSPEMERIPGPSTGSDYEIPHIDLPMVWVSPGNFTMGSPPNEGARLPEEGPQTQVRISRGYWIGVHEVTQLQYETVTGQNPSQHQAEKKPVEYVTWTEAVAFCHELTKRESASSRLPAGYEYRLPTEAEWEYAARAGQSTPFHWGNTADWSQGNFKGKYPRDFDEGSITAPTHYGTRPVGSYQPNPWGLYDVHGNVREWTLDAYNARLPGDAQTDWVQLDGSSRRVVRGGGWEDFAIHARTAYRGDGLGKDSRSASAGFRVVLGPKINR